MPAPLLAALARMQYETPTEVQDRVIPIALTGQDILASSRTGSGKTAAFSIPVVAQLMQNPGKRVLVLVPTRELAQQVADVLSKMARDARHLGTLLLIGGEPIGKQLMRLRERPAIIVGTPGRVEDHLSRGSLSLSNATFLVLDEVDRMLDMGFSVPIGRIIKQLPVERQTLMFSATLDQTIEPLTAAYLKQPARIDVQAPEEVKDIQEEYICVQPDKKLPTLLAQLNERKEGSMIIFVKTQIRSEQLSYQLRNAGIKSQALHGGLKQHQRRRIIDHFRRKYYNIIVATDVAARGLDIDHIKHVINYDFPQAAADYTHRIGRTGRGGAKGFAFSMLASHQEQILWKMIHNEPVQKRPRLNFAHKRRFKRKPMA